MADFQRRDNCSAHKTAYIYACGRGLGTSISSIYRTFVRSKLFFRACVGGFVFAVFAFASSGYIAQLQADDQNSPRHIPLHPVRQAHSQGPHAFIRAVVNSYEFELKSTNVTRVTGRIGTIPAQRHKQTSKLEARNEPSINKAQFLGKLSSGNFKMVQPLESGNSLDKLNIYEDLKPNCKEAKPRGFSGTDELFYRTLQRIPLPSHNRPIDYEYAWYGDRLSLALERFAFWSLHERYGNNLYLFRAESYIDKEIHRELAGRRKIYDGSDLLRKARQESLFGGFFVLFSANSCELYLRFDYRRLTLSKVVMGKDGRLRQWPGDLKKTPGQTRPKWLVELYAAEVIQIDNEYYIIILNIKESPEVVKNPDIDFRLVALPGEPNSKRLYRFILQE